MSGSVPWGTGDLQYVSPSTTEGLVRMWKWMTGASYQTVRDTPKIMPYKGLLLYIWKRCMNLTYVKWEAPVWHRPKNLQLHFICKLICLSVMHFLNNTLSRFRDLIPSPSQSSINRLQCDDLKWCPFPCPNSVHFFIPNTSLRYLFLLDF